MPLTSDDALRLLACCACDAQSSSPIYQCPKGHVICGKCRDAIEKRDFKNQECPSCLTNYGGMKIRCLVAEEVADLMGLSGVGGGAANGVGGKEAGNNSKAAEGVNGVNASKRNVEAAGRSYDSYQRMRRASQNSREASTRSVKSERSSGSSRRRGSGDAPPAAAASPPRRSSTVAREPDSKGTGRGPRAPASPGRTSDRRDEAAPVGTYVTIGKQTGLHEGYRLDSEVVEILPAGTYLEVTEVRTNDDDQRLRARLSNGGWISLKNLATGARWAKKVPSGTHVTRCSDVAVTEGVSSSSRVIEVLKDSDIYVEVVDTVFLEGEQRLRGKLDTGGYISLLNTATGKEWATPVRLGTYVSTMPKLSVSGRADRSGDIFSYLEEEGTYMEVAETKLVPEDGRLRGRISSPAQGWVSLVDTTTGTELAKPLHAGTYVTTMPRIAVDKGVNLDSPELGNLEEKGRYVEIVETRFLPRDKRVRGRLASGGWCSLVNCETRKEWVRPVQLGTYMTLVPNICVKEGLLRDSKKLEVFPDAKTYLEIVETRYVPEENRLRGRLAHGGWLSLMDTEKKTTWAIPVPLGTYKTVSEFGTAVCEGLRVNSQANDILGPGMNVEVVETRYVAEDERVRGRLATGGWINLVDTSNGTCWAKPRRIAEYEAKKQASSRSNRSKGEGSGSRGSRMRRATSTSHPESQRRRASNDESERPEMRSSRRVEEGKQGQYRGSRRASTFN